MKNDEIIFEDWGLISYEEAWKLQELRLQEIVEIKMENRKSGGQKITPNYLIFCEHPHVYTLGRTGSVSNLLLSEEELADKGISYFPINRGGDITYHGPGQVVGYPIIDLDNFFTDIHRYLRCLEEVMIHTLAHYNLKGDRLAGATGVWLDPLDRLRARKICAMGIRASRWVTMHGWALNVNTDLNYFGHIIPCGITDKSVTSLSAELHQNVDMIEVKHLLKKYFCQEFSARLRE